jgi:hypothetical protein
LRDIKVITHVDRINWFFTKWVTYHQSYFNNNSFIFIIDEEFLTHNQLAEELKLHDFLESQINIISFGSVPRDYAARLDYCSHFVNNLLIEILTESDVVIYLDIDELLYHENLIEILNNFTSDFLVTNFIDVTHKINSEPEFDYTKSVFSQRKYMNVGETSGWYKKPIITRVPVSWGNGKHTINNRGFDSSPENVFIIHLGKMDFNFSNRLAKENIQMRGLFESQNAFTDDSLKSYILGMPLLTIPENFLRLEI